MSTAAEVVAPYGAAWGKVIDAFNRKITSLSDEELEELIDATRNGRWEKQLSGNDYACSFEVERIARSERNRRAAKK